MSVQVDETRGHDQSLGIEDTVGGATVESTNLGDFAVLDCDVADEPRCAGSVNYGASPDDDVVMSHNLPPVSCRAMRGSGERLRCRSRPMIGV